MNLEIGSSNVTYGVIEKNKIDYFYIVKGDYSDVPVSKCPEDDIILMMSFTNKDHINNMIRALNLIKSGLK